MGKTMPDGKIVIEFKGARFEVDKRDVYIKRYALRRTGAKNAKCVETTLPWELIERFARVWGIPEAEALKRLEAHVIYNKFDGIIIQIVPKQEETEPVIATRNSAPRTVPSTQSSRRYG